MGTNEFFERHGPALDESIQNFGWYPANHRYVARRDISAYGGGA